VRVRVVAVAGAGAGCLAGLHCTNQAKTSKFYVDRTAKIILLQQELQKNKHSPNVPRMLCFLSLFSKDI
jgi:hypothetical protein